jgi:hypothetical protein
MIHGRLLAMVAYSTQANNYVLWTHEVGSQVTRGYAVFPARFAAPFMRLSAALWLSLNDSIQVLLPPPF